eukprot:gene8789-33658_t
MRSIFDISLSSTRTSLQSRGTIEKHLSDVMGVDPNIYRSLYQFYQEYWVEFGQLLTDMEKEGMMVDREHLRLAQTYQAYLVEFGELPTDMEKEGTRVDREHLRLAQTYQAYWVEFGQLLTDMEKEGTRVDREHLRLAQIQAEEDQRQAVNTFQAWATSRVPAAKYMNTSRQLCIRRTYRRWRLAGAASEPLSGSGEGDATKKKIAKAPKVVEELPPGCRSFKVYPCDFRPKLLYQTDAAVPVGIMYLNRLAGKPGAAYKALKALEAEQEEASPTSIDQLSEVNMLAALAVDLIFSKIDILDDDMDKTEFKFSLLALEAEAKAKGFGKLYASLGGGKEGLRACVAVEALCEVSAIDKLLSSFICPLQGDNISTTVGGKSRVHASLNINTETGRLSCRRPNMQNQPALEKDRYKVGCGQGLADALQ